MLDYINQYLTYNSEFSDDLWSLQTCPLPSVNDMIKRHLLFSTDQKYVEGIYKEYQKQKQKNNWLDFSDLIYSVYKLFRKFPDVAKR
jgi:superfamily I DNA/RNA helicase